MCVGGVGQRGRGQGNANRLPGRRLILTASLQAHTKNVSRGQSRPPDPGDAPGDGLPRALIHFGLLIKKKKKKRIVKSEALMD